MLGTGFLFAMAMASGAAAAQEAPPELRAHDLYFEQTAARRRSYWTADPLLAQFPDFLRMLRAEALPAVRLDAEDCVETMPCYTALRHELTFAGESLVTVFAELSGYHGGAHGGRSVEERIWDRAAGRSIAFRDLFTSWETARPILQARVCEELRHRSETQLECPNVDELAFGLTDYSGVPTGGLASAIEVRTSDYQLGSYADGRATLHIEVEAELLALIRPHYRGDFERLEAAGR